MSRVQARILIWKHRALFWCSKAYRDLDALTLDREKWRRDCVTTGNDLSAIRREAAELRKSAEDLHERLKLAIASHESSTAQLLAERALRQSAEHRADHYHDELVEALKATANWTTKSMNRRAMFGGVDSPESDHQSQHGIPNPINQKPMARQVANAVTDATLKKMLEDIRSGKDQDEQQVGPEFGPV